MQICQSCIRCVAHCLLAHSVTRGRAVCFSCWYFFFKQVLPPCVVKLFYSHWFLRKCWGIHLNRKTHLDTSESDLNSVLNGLTFYQKLSRHLKLRPSLFAQTVSAVLVDVIKVYTWPQMVTLYSLLSASFVSRIQPNCEWQMKINNKSGSASPIWLWFIALCKPTHPQRPTGFASIVTIQDLTSWRLSARYYIYFCQRFPKISVSQWKILAGCKNPAGHLL